MPLMTMRWKAALNAFDGRTPPDADSNQPTEFYRSLPRPICGVFGRQPLFYFSASAFGPANPSMVSSA